MLKFRTMVDGADARKPALLHLNEAGEGLFKIIDDPRVTRIGRWLRATSLDELPQLINVLRGEMALVGPRPVLAWEVELYQPHHYERFDAVPGITGLWQVSGRSRLTMTEALELDVEYVRRRSLRLDLWILLHTLPDGFHRIRHYGFLANRQRAAKLALCRRLLDAPSQEPPADRVQDTVPSHRPDRCPTCGGAIVMLGVLARPAPCRTSFWDDTS